MDGKPVYIFREKTVKYVEVFPANNTLTLSVHFTGHRENIKS